MRTYSEYFKVNNESGVIASVQAIRRICYRNNRKMYLSHAVIFSVKGLIICLQHDMTNIVYLEKMRDQKDVLIYIDIKFSYEPLYKQAKGLLYLYNKLLEHLTADKLELVKAGAE